MANTWIRTRLIRITKNGMLEDPSHATLLGFRSDGGTYQAWMRGEAYSPEMTDEFVEQALKAELDKFLDDPWPEIMPRHKFVEESA